MKKLSLLLSFTLLASTISPIAATQEAPQEQIKEVQTRYANFKKSFGEYLYCIRNPRSKDCDQKKLKHVKIIGATALALIAALGTKYIFFDMSNEQIALAISKYVGKGGAITCKKDKTGWLITLGNGYDLDEIENILYWHPLYSNPLKPANVTVTIL